MSSASNMANEEASRTSEVFALLKETLAGCGHILGISSPEGSGPGTRIGSGICSGTADAGGSIGARYSTLKLGMSRRVTVWLCSTTRHSQRARVLSHPSAPTLLLEAHTILPSGVKRGSVGMGVTGVEAAQCRPERIPGQLASI